MMKMIPITAAIDQCEVPKTSMLPSKIRLNEAAGPTAIRVDREEIGQNLRAILAVPMARIAKHQIPSDTELARGVLNAPRPIRTQSTPPTAIDPPTMVNTAARRISVTSEWEPEGQPAARFTTGRFKGMRVVPKSFDNSSLNSRRLKSCRGGKLFGSSGTLPSEFRLAATEMAARCSESENRSP